MFRILLFLSHHPELRSNLAAFNYINSCTARGESALAHIQNHMLLLGSRKIRPVDALDLKTNTWTPMQSPPIIAPFFQAVVFKKEIWVLGALTGDSPHELPVDSSYIFNPDKNEWRQGPALPQDRVRGSAGVTVYKNKIYLVSGIQDGHWDGHVTWFDEYSPKTNTWQSLTDAPHARDHISVTVCQHKLLT